MPRNPRLRTTAARLRRWSVTASVLALLGAGLSAAVPVTAVAAATHKPIGYFDAVHQIGDQVHVRGWAYDADTAAPARVRITVNGKTKTTLTANVSRPDVNVIYPGVGNNRGFDADLSLPAGPLTICAAVVNYPSKTAAVQLSCRHLTTNYSPIGRIAFVVQVPGALTVSGWSFDASSPSTPITTDMRVDGVRVAMMSARLPRSDVAKLYPAAGSLHGFAYNFPITEGVHTLCVGSANIGLGTSGLVSCAKRTISFSPSGKLLTVKQIPGGVSVSGYASDPDTTAPIKVTITADGTALGTVSATDAGTALPGHGFHARLLLPGPALTAGPRTICAVGVNAGTYGRSRAVHCVSYSFNWNPSVAVSSIAQKSPGATVTGWATDPDSSAAIKVSIYGDANKLATVTANRKGSSHSGHLFSATVPLGDGKHSVCAVAINILYGSTNSARKCASVTLRFEPYGSFESVARASGSTNVVAKGWTIDPDTTGPIHVLVTVDGATPVDALANLPRADIAKKHPGTGSAHGFAVSVPADSGEHRVCVQAVNTLGGSGTTSLQCKIINAVHPTPPAAPRSVSAVAGYGGAHIVWSAPARDGGAPWSRYTIKAAPGGIGTSVPAGINSATVLGLKANTKYTFSVVASNIAGASAPGRSPAVTTQKQPPAQTTPAPISTSRYIRNVRGSSSSDLATMRKEGAADANANPSGHGYLVLLDIGGQDESRAGVILSAGIRFVSYVDLVKNVKSYVDGYASKQRPSAPITIAIGTNNDMDVSRSSGISWANHMVDPIVSYAKRYPGIVIAGANDIEPGFRASYTATKSWLGGYLAATGAPFVFNGSADGCAWTVTNRGCNNGWTMSGLFNLAGGASPIRILNLPQVYNTTMAQQWRFISLTGVLGGKPKINFGGALTEWTACNQAGSCGSLTGTNAWKQMWAQLRAEPRLRPASLPYSTDLRIDG